MPREIDQIAGGSENMLGAADHFEADFGERDFAGPPLHQLAADLALEFAYLHGQGRL